MIALALALHLLATTAPAAPAPAATPPSLGAPYFAQIATLVMGVPPDSNSRAEFESAFRGAFAADELPGERLTAGNAWKAGLPLPNHFRLLEGMLAGDAWMLDISIGAPAPLRVTRPDQYAKDKEKRVVVPKLRASRGMTVALTIRVPATSGVSSRTATSSVAFYFPSGAGADVNLGVPVTGYKYPWGEAGRVAGALVLEALHRESHDLLDKERMDIAPAVRVSSNSGDPQ